MRAGFENLWKLLTGELPLPEPTQPDARERRSQAQRALEMAEIRGDTRAQGFHAMQLRAATLDVLRMEVGK